MIQKYKFVEKNIDMLRKLTKNGYISPKLLNDYSLYKQYMDIKNTSKMERYRLVSMVSNVKPVTVRFAVADMKKYVKD